MDLRGVRSAEREFFRTRSRRKASTRDVLEQHPLFHALSEADIDQLLTHARLETVPKGTVIFVKGSPGRGLIALITGAVKIVGSSAGGREAVIRIIGPGQVFSEISLLDGRPRMSTAIALAECELASIDRRDFMAVFNENIGVAMSMVALLCDRLRGARLRLEDALFLSPAGHLAKTLVDLADGANSRSIGVTQKELGQMVGISRESANKLLRAWAALGWVVVARGTIVVVNRRALEAFSWEKR
jgi:CRP/FNR family cyclic AMP-dependent transcriptional regulator